MGGRHTNVCDLLKVVVVTRASLSELTWGIVSLYEASDECLSALSGCDFRWLSRPAQLFRRTRLSTYDVLEANDVLSKLRDGEIFVLWGGRCNRILERDHRAGYGTSPDLEPMREFFYELQDFGVVTDCLFELGEISWEGKSSSHATQYTP